MEEIKKDILKNIYKPRPDDSKKYDFGLLIVIGGSEFYSGSPALSAMAAFRSGADMVRIVAPERAANIIASFSPNLAAYPLQGKWLESSHLATLLSMTESAKAVSKGKTAIVIGSGIGRSEDTQKTILEYLSKETLPVVIDADAIYALVRKPEIISGKPCLITPHGQEFFILTGRDVSKIGEEEKIKEVREQAKRFQTTILLKGPIDMVSDGERVALIKGGSPYMAKGGTGDVLAGICGALVARGVDLFDAACAGAFINKKAGEIATEKFKDGLVATDLLDAIPEVIS